MLVVDLELVESLVLEQIVLLVVDWLEMVEMMELDFVIEELVALMMQLLEILVLTVHFDFVMDLILVPEGHLIIHVDLHSYLHLD